MSFYTTTNIPSFLWSRILEYLGHTTYTRNNMGQKCEVSCGLWVLNEMIKKIYPEKIMGAIWEIPAKQESQSSPTWVEIGCIGYAMNYDLFGLGEATAISDILQSCFT